MAEPTVAETARLQRRLDGTGTVRRLALLHQALLLAYRVGRADAFRQQRGEPPRETCLEG